MRRHGRACLIIQLALSCGLACTMPPGGGVSGTVTDSSGQPIAGAELTLTSTPRVFGLVIPFAEPARVTTTTDEVGRFGVFWSHGDRVEGPLLNVSHQGYAAVAERLPLGMVECSVVLVKVGSPARSTASCRAVQQPKRGLGKSAAPSNNAMQLTKPAQATKLRS